MTIAPDITGYVDAQNGFRMMFGTGVTFLVPTVPVWPGGTAINPDTDTPYDAMVVRLNAEFTEQVKTCLPILKQGSPLRPQSDARFEPGGEFENMDMILDIATADWNDVSAASDFTLNGQTFQIEEAKPFSIANQIYRYLVYGAQH